MGASSQPDETRGEEGTGDTGSGSGRTAGVGRGRGKGWIKAMELGGSASDLEGRIDVPDVKSENRVIYFTTRFGRCSQRCQAAASTQVIHG